MAGSWRQPQRLVVAAALTIGPVATGLVGGATDNPAAAQVLAPVAATPSALPSATSSAAVGSGLPAYRTARALTLGAAPGTGRRAQRNSGAAVSGPKGTRMWTASALGSRDLPIAAERAYRAAAATMAAEDPGCQLPWTLLAGIGRVETDHGRYGGSILGDDGVSRPAIRGVALNGAGPVAALRDTDDGRLDGDRVWDRAVGPMQFIPSTWAYAGRDGDRDGVQNPNDLDDATLAAAAYLCAGSGSVATEAGLRTAVFGYNPSAYYVDLVSAFARGYRTGIFVIPAPPPPEPALDDTRAGKASRLARTGPGSASAKPQAEPKPRPNPKPQPKPKPKPTPKPTPGPPTPTPTPPTPPPTPTPTPSQDPGPTD